MGLITMGLITMGLEVKAKIAIICASSRGLRKNHRRALAQAGANLIVK